MTDFHKHTSSPPARPELPVSTVIRNDKNVCKVTFAPNIVQQAKIATNGVLGDFVIRYDVQRDMGIGDIQVWCRLNRFLQSSSSSDRRFLLCVHNPNRS